MLCGHKLYFRCPAVIGALSNRACPAKQAQCAAKEVAELQQRLQVAKAWFCTHLHLPAGHSSAKLMQSETQTSAKPIVSETCRRLLVCSLRLVTNAKSMPLGCRKQCLGMFCDFMLLASPRFCRTRGLTAPAVCRPTV